MPQMTYDNSLYFRHKEAPPAPPPQQQSNAEEASTSTKSTTHIGVQPHQVKMPVTAMEDGTNISFWKKALFAASYSKGCLSARESSILGEPEDHAAMMLILSSMPTDWHYNLAIMESAH